MHVCARVHTRVSTRVRVHVRTCVCTCVHTLSFQSCLTLCDLLAPLSTGFSRQEYWSGVKKTERQGRKVFQIPCEFYLISQFAC